MDKIDSILLEELKLEDLTETQQCDAEAIGLKIFAAISLACGGGSIYFPTRDALFKKTIRRMVRKEFDGTNLRQLASKYGISLSTAYNILKQA